MPICPLAAAHALEDAEEVVQVGQGVSSLMGSTTVYEEKVSDSFMASASVAVLNSATAKGGGRCVAANRDEIAP